MPTSAQRVLAACAVALAFVAAACGHQTPAGATPVTPVPSPTSATDVGRLFVEALGDKRYVSALGYLAPGLKSSTTDQTLKTAWDALATQYGKYKEIDQITTASVADGTDVAVPARFVSGQAVVHVVVNAALQIASFTIPPSGVPMPSLTPQPKPTAS